MDTQYADSNWEGLETRMQVYGWSIFLKIPEIWQMDGFEREILYLGGHQNRNFGTWMGFQGKNFVTGWVLNTKFW